MILTLCVTILGLIALLAGQAILHGRERDAMRLQMLEERLRYDSDQKTMIETLLRNKDVPIVFERDRQIEPAQPGWFAKKPIPPTIKVGN